MRRIIIGLLCGVAFVLALLFTTFGSGSATCSVCMDFAGRADCRTVTAPDRDQAIQQATATACSILARGVTQSMKCSRTVPTSASCVE